MLSGAPDAHLAAHRRVRANAATAANARINAASSAGDLDALAALFADSQQTIDHQTGSSWGLDGVLRSYRLLLESRDHRLLHESVAALGDSLALSRRSYGASGTGAEGLDAGEYEVENWTFTGVDLHGRIQRFEHWAPDHTGDAVARLYAHYAELLPDGPERVRAAVTARSVATQLAPPDLEAWVATWSPAIELVDHRTLGLGTLRGVDAVGAWARAMFELEDFALVLDDVLRLQPNAALVSTTTSGTARAGGGAYERPLLGIWAFGSDGLFTRFEFFDADREAEAHARFDELTGKESTEQAADRFPNAATRATDRLVSLWRARDWPGFTQQFAASFRYCDRRRIAQLELDRDRYIAFTRELGDLQSHQMELEVLATRGDRLDLTHVRQRFSDEEIGPSELEYLDVHELDADGRIIAFVRFEMDDRDAAYAELDARFEAGEAAAFPHIGESRRANAEAWASRDWDAVARAHASDAVIDDHRTLGFGVLQGAAAWIDYQRPLTELAPDARFRTDHIRICARGTLEDAMLVGTRDGGAFEIAALRVNEVDEEGRIRRIDAYDPGDLDRARARFEELASAPPTAIPEPAHPFANAATRASDKTLVVWRMRDWERLRQEVSPELRLSDRRKSVLLELDRDGMIEFTRPLGDMESARVDTELVATRGERLALMRWRVSVAGRDVGPSEIDYFTLLETDPGGRVLAMVRWDLDYEAAAWAELEARFDAGEGRLCPRVLETVAAVRAAWDRRDWEALEARCAPGFAYRDHRLLGFGRMLDDAAAWVRSQAALVELAPDSVTRIDHVRNSERVSLRQITQLGTRDGGAFETPFLSLIEVDEQGRIAGFDSYDIDKVDAARARFDDLGAPPAAHDPLRIPPNAAARAYERIVAYSAAENWDALATLCAPITFDDRRRSFLVAVGCEAFIENMKFVTSSGFHPRSTMLAISGDRLMLHRNVWTVSAEGTNSEVETLEVFEVDGEGRVVAYVLFDPSERAAASGELFERSAAGGADTLIEFRRAWNAHDLERVRAVLRDDYVFHDPRRIGLGRLEVDAYLASLTAIWDLSPDAQLGQLYDVAASPNVRVAMSWSFGTNQEGGEFESVYLSLVHIEGEHVAGIELFEPEDLDAALARFEELRPDPQHLPPNTVIRVRDRQRKAAREHDWAAVRAMVSGDFVFEDRGKRALVRGDIDTWITSMEFAVTQPGFQSENEILACVGDRLMLEEMVWTGGPGGDSYEVSHIRLVETDADERIRTSILFDSDDRVAAFAEAQARFLAGEAAGVAAQAPVRALHAAFARRDWDALRALLAEGFVHEDHRATGPGVQDRDHYVAALRELAARSPDVQREEIRTLAWNDRGRVVACRIFGTDKDSGPFERAMVSLFRTDAGRVLRVEDFELDAADRAVARLEA